MRSLFSVTTPAGTLSLLTIDELRAAAGVPDGSQDAVLTPLGLRLSASIAKACCIAGDGVNPPTLLRETCTETFRPEKRPSILRLSRRPVTSVVSVVENGTTLTAADHEIDPATGLLSRLSGDAICHWQSGRITVSYVAGYATALDDLKLAASKLCTALYSETARDPNLKREDIPGVREVEYWVAPSDDPLLSQEIADLLAPYRQYWF